MEKRTVPFNYETKNRAGVAVKTSSEKILKSLQDSHPGKIVNIVNIDWAKSEVAYTFADPVAVSETVEG